MGPHGRGGYLVQNHCAVICKKYMASMTWNEYTKEVQLIYLYVVAEICKGHKKLDQETWFCRTHMEDISSHIQPFPSIPAISSHFQQDTELD